MKENMQTINKIVLIGASTGGPGEIQKIIFALPILKNSAIIIAQHMAIEFLPSFAKRLQEISKNHISIAQNGEPLTSGYIYFCNASTEVTKINSELYFTCMPSSLLNSYNPNINIIFKSLVPFAADFEILALILTGIGDDGVAGCQELSLIGARIITQDKDSAIVDGMPFRARESVKNIEVKNMNSIIESVIEFCS